MMLESSQMGTSPQIYTPEGLPVLAATADWDNKRALEIAKSDFEYDERFRLANHDRRFVESDRLYLGWVQRKNWDGTKIPRSAVPIFLAYQQIEALIPHVIAAIFGQDIPFDVEPTGGSLPAQARAVRELLKYQLDDIDGSDIKFKTLREICRLCYKSSNIYGNGIAEFGWEQKTLDRWVYQRVPDFKLVRTLFGSILPIPTGTSHVEKSVQKVDVSKPTLRDVKIQDFYIDANCSSANVQDARRCSVRTLMTIEQLQEYRETEGFDIPDEKKLKELASRKFHTQGDNDKAQQEAYRGGYWQPQLDQTNDPNQVRVEVIRYHRKNRIVWMLGREHIAYNQPNAYSVLPFVNAFHTDVPGRFYGLSICDLVEGDQKLAEAIVNARIDELNLIINAPLIKKRGMSIASYRMRPGIVLEAENPKEDLIKMEWPNITANAYVEVDALERRTQKTTGITDLSAFGTPSAGGNSTLRTATGVNAQSAATGVRIEYQVENFEDQFMVPVLSSFWMMDQMFLDPNRAIQISPNVQIDPVDTLNASVKFKMRAASRMRMRHSLLNGGLALILQTYLNPEWIQLMVQFESRIPDLEAIDGLISDALNMPALSLTKQLQPEQLQAYMQQQNAANQVKMAMQQERLQAQGEHIESKNETTLLNTLVSKVVTPDVAHEVLGLPAPAAIAAKHAPKPVARGR
jgi:hypothetical protein